MTSLGPLPGIGSITGTAPLTASGILNNVVGTTVTKVLSAVGKGGVARIKVKNLDAAKLLAVAWVANGAAAPTHTATGGGTSTDGLLVVAGDSEQLSLRDTYDLYIVGSAASSPYQIAVFFQ